MADSDQGATGSPIGDVALEILERLIRNAEQRADAAESYARSLEQKMAQAIAEAQRRADEHLGRIEALEDLLRRADAERAGLIQALQESIRTQQLQAAAPVAIAQAEAEKERRDGHFASGETVPPPPEPASSSPAPAEASAPAPVPAPTAAARPHKPAKPKTTARLARWLFGPGKAKRRR